MSQLQGVTLDEAELQGAHLVGTRLEGAKLDLAQLQGASLNGADLEGASLDSAQLQGADLRAAHLQGARLDRAQLQGAHLEGAELDGTSLNGAFLWRAQLTTSGLEDLFAPNRSLHWAPQQADGPWTDKSYAILRKSIEDLVPDGPERKFALANVAKLDCARTDNSLASCDPSQPLPYTVEAWKNEINSKSIGSKRYASMLAQGLGDVICSHDWDRIDVLRGLLRSGRLLQTGREMLMLAKRFTTSKCPVSADLTDDDKRKIAITADEAISALQ
jgi:uncharacterized protein YjbI with pentapeptide repeats